MWQYREADETALYQFISTCKHATRIIYDISYFFRPSAFTALAAAQLNCFNLKSIQIEDLSLNNNNIKRPATTNAIRSMILPRPTVNEIFVTSNLIPLRLHRSITQDLNSNRSIVQQYPRKDMARIAFTKRWVEAMPPVDMASVAFKRWAEEIPTLIQNALTDNTPTLAEGYVSTIMYDFIRQHPQRMATQLLKHTHQKNNYNQDGREDIKDA
jgi:hypothetical protein